MGRICVDVDQELEKEIGDISTYITEQGEPAFREKEAEMIAKFGTRNGPRYLHWRRLCNSA